MAIKAQAFIEHFREIDLKRPSDIIIQQIRDLISSGVLKPGDRLPPERALAERFGVGRGYLREAIRKLEFYGILKTVPKSGTLVADLGKKALEGLISNVLNLEKEDIESLMETRAILEIHSARLAALRASDVQIKEIAMAHQEFCQQVEGKNPSLEEDLIFHLKIAECSKNSVLRSLISLMTPDILTFSRDLNTCRNGRFLVARKEHEAVLHAIQARNPERAAEAMADHMKMSQLQFGSRKTKRGKD